MKTLSTKNLAETVTTLRKQKGLTQKDLGNQLGLNKVLIDRIEHADFMPSIVQLEALANVLEFDLTDMFIETEKINHFSVLRNQTLNSCENEGLDKLFQMMLALRQQIFLRDAFENQASN